jgi:hypothetical protein
MWDSKDLGGGGLRCCDGRPFCGEDSGGGRWVLAASSQFWMARSPFSWMVWPSSSYDPNFGRRTHLKGFPSFSKEGSADTRYESGFRSHCQRRRRALRIAKLVLVFHLCRAKGLRSVSFD